MTTPYIDPKIVFASDAPTQDKPPAFNNYVKGMDETRSNNGRPTIKQFNFIQQQNDLKFLYIHERGACLPFVEGFPYENNAIVFKDGFIQQKNGASWIIPFMRGSQNLAELTDVSQSRTNLDVYSKAETDAIAVIPNATETVAGKAKIATTAISQAGVNDTDIITAKKLRDALNATGEAPISACRAWVSFDGSTSPPTIKGASNVASISKLQSGRYVINFQTPMANSDYAVLTGFASGLDTTAILMVSSWGIQHGNATLKTTTQLDVSNKANGSAATYDGKDLFIAIIG